MAIAVLGLIVSGCIPVVPPAEQDEPGALPNKVSGDDGEVWNITTVPETEYLTIQAAIDDASPYDTIIVGLGTYYLVGLGGSQFEPVSITKSLTLRGAGSGTTFLNPEHPSGHCDVISIQASDVTIEGFTVTGGDFGIRIGSSSAQSGIDFNDVVVIDNYGSGFVFDNLYGTTAVTNVTFTDCQANSNGNRGIYFSPGKIANNISLDNTSCNNNQIMGFNCQGTMDTLDISGGTFNNNVGGIPFGTSEGPYYGFGISLENCTNGTISDVTAQDNGTAGPLEGGAGIVVKIASHNVTITGTMLGDNPIGLWLEPPWSTNPTPTGVSIHFSNIEGNRDYGVKNEVTTTTVDAINNWWGHASGPGGEYGRVNKKGKVIGKGDKVSANVDWDPWLPQPVDHTPHHLVPPGLVK